MKKLKNRFAVAAITAATAVSGMSALAPAADASYLGNAYLVVNNWRCVGGGNVISITGAVDWVWSGGDAGDNIIYPRVRVGDTNTFNGRAFCNRPWYKGGGYWINAVGWQFRPSANNQTFWY